MEMAMSLPNVKGGLTFFPGYVEHYVPVYEGEEPRVSLAMDIYVYMPPLFGVQDHLQHRLFIDPSWIIPNGSVDVTGKFQVDTSQILCYNKTINYLRIDL